MTAIRFHVWGCRGGRNTRGSRIGNSTSCYSLVTGEDLFVFDAGRGLVTAAEEVAPGGQLADVKRVHVIITHAHMDHWEGLKDAQWMWRRGNGVELTVFAPNEALTTIRAGHEPPAFVALDVLALGTLAKLSFVPTVAGTQVALPGATLTTAPLHHYSGIAPNRRFLETVGYRLAIDGGPAIAYLCDHEPTAATQPVEDALLADSQLALVDANYARIADHAFGHGSIEYAAQVARRHTNVHVLATHHGPMLSDRDIDDAHRTFGKGCANLAVSTEHSEARWNPAARRFEPVP